MLEFMEADPLPIECQRCVDQYCDECDCLGLRWPLTEESQRQLDQIIEEKKRLVKLKREQMRKQKKQY